MKKAQKQIKEFMVKAGQETPDRPVMPDARVRELRVKLIAEELCELAEAFGCFLRIDHDNGKDQPTVTVGVPNEKLRAELGLPTKVNLRDAYDAVLDLMVVVIGSGVAMGTELEPGWQEVHRSNMSKFIDGHRREDGKWVKGPSYSPAQLELILDDQTLQAVMRDRQLKL